MESYNLAKMQELSMHFYNLTGIKVSIYDGNENEICFYPKLFTPFCQKLRSDKHMNERCLECDSRAFAVCKKTHEQYFYTCHAGLLECVSPILHENKIIGYIALGQMKTKAQSISETLLSELDEKTVKELKLLYHKLPVMDVKKIHSAIHIINACTSYEYLKRFVNTAQNKIDLLLDQYINDHPCDDLSVPKLCTVFHLSHSEIYQIFKQYFNSTPAEYVKLRRLFLACELLKKTTFKVNEIAKLCGIPDYNYFSKSFKKQFNQSPRQYRNSLIKQSL